MNKTTDDILFRVWLSILFLRLLATAFMLYMLAGSLLLLAKLLISGE